MRYCLILLLVLLFSGSASAAPALRVESLEHDFGEIVQGDRVDYVFRFHNAGDQVLEIGQLRSSCGCTAALLSTRRLAPGAMGELQVTFNSQDFRGEIQKMVTFDTNDPDHASITFSLRGTVKAELFLDPERVNWGVVEQADPLVSELEIVNNSSRSIRLQSPEVTSPGIQAELSSLTVAPGERTSLRISAEFPPDKKRIAGYVIIVTDFTNVPQLKVPVSARMPQ